jgi:hypothetical protein
VKNKNEPKLLTRDVFREAVFKRDGRKCVFCGAPAKDAHHIIERRLFPDGGYYIENGAAVCEDHHIACEKTLISVEAVRKACGTVRKVVPPHLYVDTSYDKWGNPILPNGTRRRGELFYDESVQKILAEAGVLTDFVYYVKHPRTHHVPWSLGINDDDRVVEDMEGFRGRRVVVTEKMDGENTTIYNDFTHARSVDSGSHPSRDWLKNFASGFMHDIPSGWRVCGENVYAKHSIGYSDLPSYFLGFSVWNEMNICLSWDETLEWFELLGITPVRVMHDGTYYESAIRAKCDVDKHWDTCEGYVIRVAEEIGYGEFKSKVAKCVRKGHVQTAQHWFYGQEVVKNGLRSE